jgi:hypothetical protein
LTRIAREKIAAAGEPGRGTAGGVAGRSNGQGAGWYALNVVYAAGDGDMLYALAWAADDGSGEPSLHQAHGFQ